jgi:dihydrofolate reductase
MRKVFGSLFSSIDGAVQAPNEWQHAFDEGMGAAMSRIMEGQDAVLLGRQTFEEWAGFWPTSTDEPFASWINSTPKYVASTTLTSVDAWQGSTLIPGSVADFVRELKQQEGGTIGTAGSPGLVRSLLEAGVLDELTLFVHPVVAGGAYARLFPEGGTGLGFEVVESETTSSGTIVVTYRPVAPSA